MWCDGKGFQRFQQHGTAAVHRLFEKVTERDQSFPVRVAILRSPGHRFWVAAGPLVCHYAALRHRHRHRRGGYHIVAIWLTSPWSRFYYLFHSRPSAAPVHLQGSAIDESITNSIEYSFMKWCVHAPVNTIVFICTECSRNGLARLV